LKKNALAPILLLIIPWFFNAESPAQVYKYVDKNGVAHFSNVPADPRYKRASKSINPKAPQKPKGLKPRKDPGATSPKNFKRLNNPPGHSN
jgi:hypothetical protein